MTNDSLKHGDRGGPAWSLSARFLLAPRQWLSWLTLGLLRSAAFLPVSVALSLGNKLGLILGPLLSYRRQVAETNLMLCFPELSHARRHQLLREHMGALGMSVMEMALAWWAPKERLAGLARLEGAEHLTGALAQGKGVLLVTGHFTPFEMGGRLILDHAPLAVIYQEFRNPVFHRAMVRARRYQAHRIIHRRDLRGLIGALRHNEVVWYAPDQDAGHRGVFAPFFGVPAATHTATSRIARASGAAVLPYTVQRLTDPLGYSLKIHPPLADFPGSDATQDAARINAFLESEIRLMPAQYLWVHRRFKTRPPGREPALYPPKRRRVGRWPLRTLSTEAFERLRNSSETLSRDAFGDKVLRTGDGIILKLFRTKHCLSSARLYSYARRFVRNARRLRKLAIPTVEVRDVRRLSSPPRDVVFYRELAGDPLRDSLAAAAPDEARHMLLGFADFVARLHRKGVYFRSLHLGNVLILPDTGFGLIDISDLRVRRRPLGLRARARNFRHLMRRAEDAALIEHIGSEEFFSEYCRQAGLGLLNCHRIGALLKRQWSSRKKNPAAAGQGERGEGPPSNT